MTVVSRLRVKNTGAVTSAHELVDVQIRSAGTSGHADAVESVSDEQDCVDVFRHRSETEKSTRTGAFDDVSTPLRWP